MKANRRIAFCWQRIIGFTFAICMGTVSASTLTYVYDQHGRLRSVTRNDSSSSTYTLDGAGNRINVTNYIDNSAPAAPTGLTGAAQSTTRINLSWNAAVDIGQAGIAGYHVHRNGAWLASPGNVTSYSDTTVSASTSYQYTVAAYDLRGNTSPHSSAITVTTPATADTTPPTVPTGLSATAVGATQVNLSWSGSTDSGGSGLGGYYVYRNSAHIVTISGTAYSDTSLAAGGTYSYRVAAFDNATPPNVSAQSSAASVTLGGIVTISNLGITAQGSAGATASYQLSSSGDILTSTSGGSDAGDWISPKTGMGGFQVLATRIDGNNCLNGTYGSWLSLGSSPLWSARMGNTSALTIGHCNFRIDVRDAATLAVVGTATISLTVVDTPP